MGRYTIGDRPSCSVVDPLPLASLGLDFAPLPSPIRNVVGLVELFGRPGRHAMVNGMRFVKIGGPECNEDLAFADRRAHVGWNGAPKLEKATRPGGRGIQK